MEKDFLKDISDHQGIILKVCRMYCSDVEESEDLFQEIVLQLWRSYPKFKAEAKISTWIYRVGLNTAITRLRKNNRKISTREIIDTDLNLPSVGNDRVDIEYSDDLQTAINALNKFDKAIMMLYLDEKSYLEMAEIMGISETNIGVKINRIKKKLKEILKPALYGTR